MGRAGRLRARLASAGAWLPIGTLAVLGWWLSLKFKHLNAFEYTSPDLSIGLQLSRSLWEKGALLYDNMYGWHGALHGFYVLPVLYPFTRPLGAPGLFVALGAAHAAALLLVARLPGLAASRKLALLALSLGPVGWWLFNDEIWGFHAELLYVPLAFLLSALLRAGARRAWLALVGLALLSVKEDGAVLLTSLLVAHAWLRRDPLSSFARTARVCLRIVAAGALAFLLGMALVLWQGRALPGENRPDGAPVTTPRLNDLRTADARLEQALQRLGVRLRDERETLRLGRSALGTGLLLASAAVSLGPLAGGRALVAFVPLSLPLYAVALVGSAGYPDAVHWLTWPPRFASLWALLLGVALLAARQTPGPSFRRVLVYVALSWGLQTIALDRARFEAPLPGRSDLHRAPRLADHERATLECLATRLPRRAPVLAERYMQAVFDRQDWTWAPQLERAFAAPEIAVCDRRSAEPDCRHLAAELFGQGLRRESGYLVLAGAGPAANVIESCLATDTETP